MAGASCLRCMCSPRDAVGGTARPLPVVRSTPTSAADTPTDAHHRDLNMSPNTSNILRCYWRARPDELHEGHMWYSQAADEACRRIPDRGREIILAIVAALSPQTPWARNIQYA